MADFKVIAPLANRIIEETQAWSGIAGTLSGLVLAPIAVGVTITILWHGLAIMRGAAGAHVMDVFMKALRAFFVVTLAVGAGAYSSNVVGFFQDLRDSLTALFVRGADTSYTALDSAINTALSTWDPTWNWASEHITLMSFNPDLSGVVAIGCWFFMTAALTLFAAICAVNLVLIDFSLALIFALGPMFVACFAFPATARFTDAWLGGVLKYTFTAVVISAMVGLGIGLLQRYTAGLGANAGALDFVTSAFAAVAASIVLCILASRIPSIAGDMVGGIGMAAFGPAMAARPLSAIAAMGKSAAGGAVNAAAYGAGVAASSTASSATTGPSLGARAVSSFKPGGGGITDAVRGHGMSAEGKPISNGGMRNAFQLGRGVASGTGTISSGRPVDRVHVPGST